MSPVLRQHLPRFCALLLAALGASPPCCCPPLFPSSSVGPICGFSPREMRLEDGTDLGLVEVPSWLLRGNQPGGVGALCPPGPWPVSPWENQPLALWEGE